MTGEHLLAEANTEANSGVTADRIKQAIQSSQTIIDTLTSYEENSLTSWSLSRLAAIRKTLKPLGDNLGKCVRKGFDSQEQIRESLEALEKELCSLVKTLWLDSKKEVVCAHVARVVEQDFCEAEILTHAFLAEERDHAIVNLCRIWYYLQRILFIIDPKSANTVVENAPTGISPTIPDFITQGRQMLWDKNLITCEKTKNYLESIAIYLIPQVASMGEWERKNDPTYRVMHKIKNLGSFFDPESAEAMGKDVFAEVLGEEIKHIISELEVILEQQNTHLELRANVESRIAA